MHQRYPLTLAILVCCLSVFISSSACAAVIYVDSNVPDPNDGQSWPTAYKYLQDALAVANYGDEIRVAEGVYRTDESQSNPEGTADPNDAFDLTDGVILRGGYAGLNSEDPDMRDITAYETILSGDLDGNDNTALTAVSQVLNDPNRSENSYHVITAIGCDANTLLDGFTVTGGMATGTVEPHFNGGAAFIDSSNLTISNCRFRYNAARYGGAVYNLGSSSILTACDFVRNYAENAGGALRNKHRGNAFLSDCRFIENKAAAHGGAMANSSDSSPTVIQCTFSHNWARQGGAINNYGDCGPQINQSIFEYNAADSYGGAVNNQYYSNTELSHCRFLSNAAPDGGALYNDQSDLRVTNCIATGNIASVEYGGLGGTVYNNADANDVSFINCTFADNIAAAQGGPAFYNKSGNPMIQNCVFWDSVDTGNPPIISDSGSPFVSNSCIQGGWSGAGVDNIATNPLLADIPDQLRLLAFSPCIDTGSNSPVTVGVDLDGNERMTDGTCDGSGIVDMGAYEFEWVSSGDFAGGCNVNIEDFAVLAQSWQQNNPAIDIAPYLDPDGIVDINEFLVMIENWLMGSE